VIKLSLYHDHDKNFTAAFVYFQYEYQTDELVLNDDRCNVMISVIHGCIILRRKDFNDFKSTIANVLHFKCTPFLFGPVCKWFYDLFIPRRCMNDVWNKIKIERNMSWNGQGWCIFIIKRLLSWQCAAFIRLINVILWVAEIFMFIIFFPLIKLFPNLHVPAYHNFSVNQYKNNLLSF
jgi:hypothetical protein